MTQFTSQEIEEIYRTHPLRKEAILQRLLNSGRTLVGLTELDLAEDFLTEVTDQNHIGGLAFTRTLATKAGIRSGLQVLDLGCGLGGSARCLAWLHGCRVHGLDLSPERVRDARELTELVGLQDLVTFDHADVMTAPLPAKPFDVLWGQSAWVHLENKLEFLCKWAKALKLEGCLALEDVCLQRPPASQGEKTLVAALQDHWKSYLIGMDEEGGWRSIFAACHFELTHVEDCSAHLHRHFENLKSAASRPESAPVSPFEQESWRLALEAVGAGLIGYSRIVARKTP